jgi:hypothetical protein
VQFPAMFTGIPLRPMQGLYLNYERYGWVQKQHLVTGWTLNIPSFTCDLVLQEDDADVHAWSIEDEIEMSAPQDVILPDPTRISPPASISVITPEIIFERLSVEWAASPSAAVAEYELEYRTRDAATWTSAGKFGADDAARKHTVDRSVATDFRVRALSVSAGVKSTWRTSSAPDDLTDVLSSGDGELSWSNTGSDFISIWRDGVFHMQVDVVGSSQLQTGLPAGSYQIRAKNADGNVSNPSAAVIIAIGGSDDGDGGDSDDGGGDT